MEKFGLGIAFSILLIACGSNAENNVTETAVSSQEEIEEGIVQPVEEVIVKKNTELEEVIEKEELPEGEEVIEPVKKLSKKIVEKPIETEEVKTEVIKEPQTGIPAIVKASHDNWNSLTKQYVTADGKVNYKAMKANLNQITLYLSHLNQTPPKDDWSKNEKLAYWINLYNASTVYLIATNYPTTSITKLSGGKPWDKKFVKSGGKVYSLNQIENDIVRPRFKDPRIHAALNCAAVSCPKMMNSAFLPEALNKQLDQQCYAWINDRNRNEVGPNNLKISKIFEWYGEDFKAGGGIIKFVGKYSRTKIMISSDAKISYKEYNW
ncbi:MAG: DUF547 domain-containing protein, partial [Vicingaceae bacterium]|nr:DUF547 domain-containing protein [Vicingaceae bacterium]